MEEQNGGNATEPVSDREKIYQRGVDGLKEIKKARLESWLSSAEGVGNQAQDRILMLFERNEQVHKNPDILYNILDDESSASPSYINTVVEDVFQPERENEDLLMSQGYTPWFNRGNIGSRQQQNTRMGGQRMGQGGPMNATGRNSFTGGQQQQNQQQYSQQQQPQGQGQPQQQQSQQPQQKESSDSSSESDSGGDGISRQEAEMMMQQAVQQANENDNRGALAEGLSEATDDALREMASNIGGLAGTFQKVVDEALVEYAKNNPEWVIENMSILQKIIGSIDDVPGDAAGGSSEQPAQDQKVDSAVENLEPASDPAPDQSYNQRQAQPTQQQSRNPDLDLSRDDMTDSGFEPRDAPRGRNNQQQSPDRGQQGNDSQTRTESQQSREETSNAATEDDSSSEEQFDEIFGDVAN
jgi:hypothetical protein